MDGHLSLGALVAFQSADGQLHRARSRASPASGWRCRSCAATSNGSTTCSGTSPTAVASARPRPHRRLSGELELRGRDVRLPAALAAAGRRLRPAPRARPARGAGGRLGQRQVDLAKLVCGLYQPWSGEILLRRPAARPLAARRRCAASLGVVDQDISLFEGTVRDNLTLWDPTIPEADVVQAAKDACIHDDISQLAGRLRRARGRGRLQLQRRPAPAAGDRARAGAAAGAAGARRGDQRARPRDRAPGRREPAPARLSAA